MQFFLIIEDVVFHISAIEPWVSIFCVVDKRINLIQFIDIDNFDFSFGVESSYLLTIFI